MARMARMAQVCYHVMGLLHATWPPIPGRMKDYIATPKPNGYRSLHTVVLPVGTQGTWDIFPLRLLIRTAAMHQVGGDSNPTNLLCVAPPHSS
jgi:(p)ppGpp synthase/HD superfamily hydrolase